MQSDIEWNGHLTELSHKRIYYAQQTGFTLVELVMVIILVGILAVYALPRLDIDIFKQHGYYQQVLAALRYGQKQAVASNCTMEVKLVSNTQCQVIRKSGCGGLGSDLVLSNLTTGTTNFCDGGEAGSMTPVTFSFDRLGVLTANQSTTIDGKTITVYANTGFIKEP